jgi:3-oxosteroid 1-dehydrogenase
MSSRMFDETFDFVIVGSGGGSMCAALFMRSLNKSVLILEKTGLVGGTTARSGGVMWIPNNRFMAEDGIEDGYDAAMTYLDVTSGRSENAPGTTRERRAAYVTEAPKMIDFLVSQDIKLRRVKTYPDYYDERPGGSVPGRTVVAELFDANKLGKVWAARLRPNYMPLLGTLDELYWLPTVKRGWKGKIVAAKIAWRVLAGKLTGRNLVTNGAALQGRMLQAVLKAGVDIRVNATVDSFITADDAVKGVVARCEGHDVRIGARLGVLVNAGGFAQNQAMRDQYMPGTSAQWTAAGPGDTGEMIREMIRLGAAVGQMDECVGNQMSIPPGLENTDGNGLPLAAVSGMMDIAKPHGIVVDQTGIRYMNEAGSYMEFCQCMLARHREAPAIPSWWIMDSQYMSTYLFCGTMPGAAQRQVWINAGWLKTADTPEALARLCNIDPQTLAKALGKFNADARSGKDTQFHRGERAYDRWLGDPLHRPSAALGTIEKPPFYATPVVPGDVGTFGGVITDSHARVLRADGSPIPGLYATGTSTASVMGRVYPGAGASIGPSFTWGYIAARHATNVAGESLQTHEPAQAGR